MRFLVLDNFFRDPFTVRNKALARPFTSKSGHFPGARSVNQFRSPELYEFCLNASTLLAENGSLKIQYACFQFMGKGQRKSYVHSDPLAGYAGIVFLGEKSGVYPGTSFFRHKKTGLERFEWNNQEWTERNFSSQADYGEAEALLDRDRFNTKKWTRLTTLYGAFNRLILFPAEFLHQNASAWGTNPGNGRLTYNFWLGVRRAKR